VNRFTPLFATVVAAALAFLPAKIGAQSPPSDRGVCQWLFAKVKNLNCFRPGENCDCPSGGGACPASCVTFGCSVSRLRADPWGSATAATTATFPCNTLSYFVRSCPNNSGVACLFICPNEGACLAPFVGPRACAGTPTYIVPCV